VNQVEANLLRQTLDEAVSGGAAHDAHGVALNRYIRMPAKAGIQQAFADILDSRVCGNDKTAGCDSV
jgi:hypothetical protein